MPVVPFSPKQSQAPKQVSAVKEPWLLMAAATMDAQGRLMAEDGGRKLKVGASEGDPS